MDKFRTPFENLGSNLKIDVAGTLWRSDIWARRRFSHLLSYRQVIQNHFIFFEVPQKNFLWSGLIVHRSGMYYTYVGWMLEWFSAVECSAVQCSGVILCSAATDCWVDLSGELKGSATLLFSVAFIPIYWNYFICLYGQLWYFYGLNNPKISNWGFDIFDRISLCNQETFCFLAPLVTLHFSVYTAESPVGSVSRVSNI